MEGLLLLCLQKPAIQQRFFRQLGFSEVWSLLPTKKYLGSQHLLQLGGFQIGKSFHQLSCVLEDGGVLPQK